MEKLYILSIDMGTSSCKAALFDAQGTILGTASKEHGTVYRSDNGAEQDPLTWWKNSVYAVRAVLEKTGVSPYDIKVIGTDSHSSSVIPVSQRGEVLHPAMIWTDRRAVKEREWMDAYVGEELFTRINGNRNDESNAAPKMKWFQQHYPQLYKETYKFLNASGYLVYRMTGKMCSNISEGGLTQLLDIEQGVWSEELVKACGLDMEKLPDIYPCYEIVGGLNNEAAKELGMIEGTPVVAGAMDSVACGLGCGISQEGDAYITGGTVTALGVCTRRPLKNGAVHVYHHIVPGAWCNMAGVDFGGGNYRWFRDNFMEAGSQNDVYGEMNRMAESVVPGAEKLLFLPTSVGQRCPQWDGDMRGVFFGIAPHHTKAHFIRSVMEGNAFAIREVMEIMEQLGAEVKNLMIAGGIARSGEWMNIFENVLGRPLFGAEFEEATAMGCMLNAAYGAGILDSFHKAKDYCNRVEIPFDKNKNQVYNKLYNIYQMLYPSMKNSFWELARLDTDS